MKEKKFTKKPTLDILLTISSFATTCQLAVIRVLVDRLLNICLHFILIVPNTHSTDYMSTYSTNPNPKHNANLTVY